MGYRSLASEPPSGCENIVSSENNVNFVSLLLLLVCDSGTSLWKQLGTSTTKKAGNTFLGKTSPTVELSACSDYKPEVIRFVIRTANILSTCPAHLQNAFRFSKQTVIFALLITLPTPPPPRAWRLRELNVCWRKERKPANISEHFLSAFCHMR